MPKKPTETTIFETHDGSHSLISAEFGEAYHSRHGAIQESMHVFVGHALEYMAYRQKEIRIFEMGFGTGLNAWLSLLFAKQANINIQYFCVEKFPIATKIAEQLNYSAIVIPEFYSEINSLNDKFEQLHTAKWNILEAITPNFSLIKYEQSLADLQFPEQVDIIYYDAFAPEAQPELWTKAIFEKMFEMLRKNGILTTYCAKGYVRRNLKAAGFEVERLEGPPGKREMLRAQKIEI